MFRIRHDRIEEEERRKYMTHVTPTSAQQQRRQRTGRASESVSLVGVMTPDPSSPDVASEAGGAGAQAPQQRVTPSNTPTALHTSGSHTSFANELLPDDGRYELTSRRRASSVSSTLSAHDRLRPYLDDYGVQSFGWPRRVFPLSEQELSNLLMDRPPDTSKYSTRASRAVHVPRTSTSREVIMYDDSLLDSPPQSPSSSASTAGVAANDDDDKEWTIKPVASRQSSLILKIAKR